MDSTSSRLTLGIDIINIFCINENDFLPPFFIAAQFILPNQLKNMIVQQYITETMDILHGWCVSKHTDGSYTLLILYLFPSFS
jgi:hypothetical protein